MTKATQTVHSAVSAVPATDIRDIRPPVEIANPWVWLGWALLVLALVAAGVLLWRWWRRKKNVVALVPPVPPHVRAKQRLASALALIGQPREFCIAVSDALRVYLEERFQFRAPERTTEEFLLDLKKTDLLLRDQKESLEEFLTRCDLAKFAKYEPRELELRELHASALRLVEETEPSLELAGSGVGPGAAPSAPAVHQPSEPVTQNPQLTNRV